MMNKYYGNFTTTMTKVLSIDVGMVNLGICILREDKNRTPPYVIEHWENVNLHATDATRATQNVIKEFRKRDQCYNVDRVVIESQNRSVSKMKRLSNGIQAHFETVAWERDLPYKIADWSSGGVKLKVYTGPKVWDDSEVKSRNHYQHNKQIAIVHTRALLEINKDDANWKRWFDSLLKKDDVADAFLQGAHFIETKILGRGGVEMPPIPELMKKRKRINPLVIKECIIID